MALYNETSLELTCPEVNQVPALQVIIFGCIQIVLGLISIVNFKWISFNITSQLIIIAYSAIGVVYYASNTFIFWSKGPDFADVLQCELNKEFNEQLFARTGVLLLNVLRVRAFMKVLKINNLWVVLFQLLLLLIGLFGLSVVVVRLLIMIITGIITTLPYCYLLFPYYLYKPLTKIIYDSEKTINEELTKYQNGSIGKDELLLSLWAQDKLITLMKIILTELSIAAPYVIIISYTYVYGFGPDDYGSSFTSMGQYRITMAQFYASKLNAYQSFVFF